VGDIILHDDVEKTVGVNDIKNDELMGLTIFGDCFYLGRKPVKKLVYNNPLKR
jgi:hypothetical protein